jgi:hypothetical protein
MKINEIITEGVWDNLKTAGQTIKQGAGTIGQGVKQGAGAVGQGVKQGAGAVANYAKQNYQQTMQARQQRFDQQAAQQFPQPKKWLGKEWSPQAQLKAKNAGSFAGDVASTIAKAGGGVGGGSLYATGTSTIPKNTIPIGTKVETQFGEYTMTDQGWVDDTNKPVKDAKTINGLNTLWANDNGGAQANPQTPANPAAPAPVVSPGGILGPGGKPIQYDEKGNPVIAQ